MALIQDCIHEIKVVERLTSAELADKLKVSVSSVERWRRGVRLPSLEDGLRIINRAPSGGRLLAELLALEIKPGGVAISPAELVRLQRAAEDAKMFRDTTRQLSHLLGQLTGPNETVDPKELSRLLVDHNPDLIIAQRSIKASRKQVSQLIRETYAKLKAKEQGSKQPPGNE